MVLVALGRKPATDDLGVERFGLEPGETIDVDEHMQVPGHEWLFAIGDINGRSLFTHMDNTRRGSPPTTCSGTTGCSHTGPTVTSRRA